MGPPGSKGPWSQERSGVRSAGEATGTRSWEALRTMGEASDGPAPAEALLQRKSSVRGNSVDSAAGRSGGGRAPAGLWMEQQGRLGRAAGTKAWLGRAHGDR